MGALADLYLKKETLETLLKTVEAKNEKGVSLTISISDETKKFEFGTGDEKRTVLQNVSAFVSQSKEQREAGKPKFYTGNGKVFWTNGTICIAKESTTAPGDDIHKAESGEPDDLPF